MPPAIVAIASAVAGYATATSMAVGFALGTYGAIVAGMLVSTAISFVGNQLFGSSPDTPSMQIGFNSGILLNKASNTAPLPVVYGSRRVGMQRVFIEVSGDNNEYLHLVFTISEGPISAINTVYLNDVASTDTKFSGYVDIYKHLGADAQTADADLIAACPSSWTSDHKLSGVAYLYVRLKWSGDVFPGGMPTFTADVDGRTVYDPRDASYVVSHNPAINTRDYLTNTRYGRGLSAALIPDAYVIAAANYCDELVSVGGVSQERYTCDGVLSPDETLLANTNYLLSSCRGMLVFTGGEYRLLIDKPETASFAFTEDNITGNWTISQGTKKNMLNRLKVRFFNPDRSWQEDIPVIDSTTLRTLDNEHILEKEISLPFTADINTARQIATIELNQSREQITCQFTAFIHGLRCEVGQVVTITHSTPGWSAKEFRILKMDIKSDDEVIVVAREYADEVYDFRTILAVDPTPNTSIPDLTVAGVPTDLVVTPTTYVSEETLYARAVLSWTAPADAFAASYDVAYKLSAGADWTHWGNTKALSAAIDRLTPGSSYDYRVRSINTLGVASDWLTASGEIMGSEITSPATPAPSYSVAGEIVTISWANCATSLPIDYYTVNGVSVGNACTYSERVDWTGDQDFDVIAYDIAGNASSTGSVTVTVTAPAAGTNIVATGLTYAIRLALTYTPGAIFAEVEIWSNTINDRSTATKVGSTGSISWTHTGLDLIDTRYYWMRIRDTYDNYSDWYPATTEGVEGSTSSDPADYLSLLEGSITEDELASDLLTRIDKIDKDYVYEHDVFLSTTAFDMVFAGMDKMLDGALTDIASHAVDITDLLSSALEAANDISALESEVASLTTTAWSATGDYILGKYVVYNDEVYRCIQAYTYAVDGAKTPGVDTDYWEESDALATIVASIETRVDDVEAEMETKATSISVDQLTNRVTANESDILQNSTDIALRVTQTDFDALGQLFLPDFSASASYDIDDIVQYAGVAYQCIETIDFTPAPTPGVTAGWETYWDAVIFAEQFSSAVSQIDINAEGISLTSTAIIGPVAYLFDSTADRSYETDVYVETIADIEDVDVRITQAGIDIDGTQASISLHATLIDGIDNRLSAAEIDIDGAQADILLKAAQSEVDGIDTRLSAAEIDIDGAQAAILLKAAQSEVDGIDTRLSAAEIDIDGAQAAILLKAAQSEVDGIDTRLSAAEIDIDGAQAAILLKAAQSEVDGIDTRLSTAESDIAAGEAGTWASISNKVLITTYETDQYDGETLRVAAAESAISVLETDSGDMQAQYTLKLNVAGRVAGIGLMLSEDAPSEFIVLADKFQVVNPTNTMTPKAVFTVGNIGGVSAVGINGDLIIDGSILARNIGANEIIANAANIKNGIITTAKIGTAQITEALIADAQIGSGKIKDLNVTTLKIQDDAVTVPVAAYTSGSVAIGASYTTIQSVTITVDVAAPVILLSSFMLGPMLSGDFIIHRGTTPITAAMFCTGPVAGQHYSHMAYDLPSVGTHTYYLYVRNTYSGAPLAWARTLMALMVKK